MLDRLLDERPPSGEIVRPARLLAAMRHGVLNGGKRLRPFLVMESAALFDADDGRDALRVAAALECVHCYSLIHDDLPAMDDDDLRRGQPTVHRAFDEATAILAGDSLLTFAFDILAARGEPACRPPARLELVAGTGARRRHRRHGRRPGARPRRREASPPDEAGIITLQAMKTGALIRYACEAGAIAGGAPAARPRAARASSARRSGSPSSSPTICSTCRPTPARWARRPARTPPPARRRWSRCTARTGRERQLAGLVEQAQALLEPFGERARLLRRAAAFIADRGADAALQAAAAAHMNRLPPAGRNGILM